MQKKLYSIDKNYAHIISYSCIWNKLNSVDTHTASVIFVAILLVKNNVNLVDTHTYR